MFEVNALMMNNFLATTSASSAETLESLVNQGVTGLESIETTSQISTPFFAKQMGLKQATFKADLKAVDLPQEQREIEGEINALLKELDSSHETAQTRQEQKAPNFASKGESREQVAFKQQLPQTAFGRGEATVKTAAQKTVVSTEKKPAEMKREQDKPADGKGKKEGNIRDRILEQVLQEMASQEKVRDNEKDAPQDQNNSDEEEGSVEAIAAKTASEASAGTSGSPYRKPTLAPPRLGVFSLYYMLDKMNFVAEGASWATSKQEIELIDKESTDTHKKQLDEMAKAMAKEKESQRWGVAVKVFSWIGSLLGIIAGAVLIATGVGAVAGALLMTSGVLTITSQVMEMTGAWKKIAEMLPTDNIDQKRAVVAWMQIGITVLCLILSGVGMVFGGIGTTYQSLNMAMTAVGAFATMGSGITSIGYGVEQFLFWGHRSEAKIYESRLATLRHSREDLMERLKEAPERLKKCLDELMNILGFERDINEAHNRAWRA